MPSANVDIVIRARDQASSVIREIRRGWGTFVKDTLTIGSGVAAANLFTGALDTLKNAVVGAAEAVVNHANDHIRVKKELQQSLRRVGAEVDEQLPKFHQYAKAIDDATELTRLQSKELVAQAAQLDITFDKLQALSITAAKFAEEFGGATPEQFQTGLAELIKGDLEALDEYIPAIQRLTTAEAKLQEATELANRRLVQQLEAARQGGFNPGVQGGAVDVFEKRLGKARFEQAQLIAAAVKERDRLAQEAAEAQRQALQRERPSVFGIDLKATQELLKRRLGRKETRFEALGGEEGLLGEGQKMLDAGQLIAKGFRDAIQGEPPNMLNAVGGFLTNITQQIGQAAKEIRQEAKQATASPALQAIESRIMTGANLRDDPNRRIAQNTQKLLVESQQNTAAIDAVEQAIDRMGNRIISALKRQVGVG